MAPLGLGRFCSEHRALPDPQTLWIMVKNFCRGWLIYLVNSFRNSLGRDRAMRQRPL